MLRVRSSCQARIASRTFRSGFREGESHRFFASCCVMVEAPRGIAFRSTACSSASSTSSRSTPWCAKNRMSSATTTARLTWTEMAAYGTQIHWTRPSRPAARWSAR